MNTTNMAKMPKSPSAAAKSDIDVDDLSGEFQLPVETEIYLLPDGQIVIADMPAELTQLLEKLGDIID